MAVVDNAPVTDRGREWASTMEGFAGAKSDITMAHKDSRGWVVPSEHRRSPVRARDERERDDDLRLAAGATRSGGAGRRLVAEEPDLYRTCFERDRDRILHSSSFRRLAGKTQVFIFPDDHQRTRLTHALEVAQVATSIARAVGLNVALTEAIAIGHDCGHGPGGHASEDAFQPYVTGGFDHASWGADVALTPLNLCEETLDGIRNHSWSRPAPSTPEGELVSWADRIAYVCHDFEDAVSAGIVREEDLPRIVRERCGTRRSQQLGTFIRAVIATVEAHGVIGMDAQYAEALAAFRTFNYEAIYLRESSRQQANAVIGMLRALVDHFSVHADTIPVVGTHERAAEIDPTLAAVTYVAGMTDRYACRTAVAVVDWPIDQLPRGIDR